MPRQSILDQTAERSAAAKSTAVIPVSELGLDIQVPENRAWLLEPLPCKEAAKELNTTTNALATYRSRGRGPAYIKHGGKVMYRRLDLLSYQQAGRVVPCK
jgi:hypothetical protein